MQESLLFHFKDGVAAERLVTSQGVFDAVVAAANAVNHHASVGGNAALMAKRLDAVLSPRGGRVTLGGPVGPALSALLGSSISVQSTVDTVTGKDEVHLILEYSAGDVFAGVTAPRANRFIISSDRANGALAALEPLHESFAATKQQPDVLVVSGLHMVDAAVPDFPHFRPKRFRDVAATLSAFKDAAPKSLIHLELASVSERMHMDLIAASSLTKADSVGMNEQELVFLYESLGGTYTDGLFAFAKADVTGSATEPASPRAVASVLRCGGCCHVVAATVVALCWNRCGGIPLACIWVRCALVMVRIWLWLLPLPFCGALR